MIGHSNKQTEITTLYIYGLLYTFKAKYVLHCTKVKITILTKLRIKC